MKNQTKIALFFGGKISRHLVLIKKAAKKLGVYLDLVSYNKVCFNTDTLKVELRDGLGINDYDVLFFRTTGKHWEEVDLIVESLKVKSQKLKPVIIDPMVLSGKPSMACKAYQMLALKSADIDVPKTVYGSLWYLYEKMKKTSNFKLQTSKNNFKFPIIIKGSGGDRGTRVFKADNLEEMEKLVRDLRKTETEEGRRYMLQEFIPNNGDYRVLVLGKKVLGVMKRTRQLPGEFKNNYSVGGKVEVANLPQNILDLAVSAAEVCGLAVAGVDVMEKNPSGLRPAPLDPPAGEAGRGALSNNPKDYVILEVNKGPQFKGFMEATGINVPEEIVKYLVSISLPAGRQA